MSGHEAGDCSAATRTTKVSEMKVSLREHCTWSRTGIGNSEEMSLEA